MSKKEQIIFGVDEVGRGPLAGPVIACAVFKQCFDIGCQNIRDSKKMSEKQREEVFEFLKKSVAVEWGIGRVGPRVIDKINIFEASKLAMIRAVNSLEKKIGERADLLLIDGNFIINLPSRYKQQAIIKGDEKVPLISMASIVAKVTRDRMMQNWHKKYPQYSFSQHKGYPTKEHRLMLKKHGICPIHRKSFGPVARLLQK